MAEVFESPIGGHCGAVGAKPGFPDTGRVLKGYATIGATCSPRAERRAVFGHLRESDAVRFRMQLVVAQWLPYWEASL